MKALDKDTLAESQLCKPENAEERMLHSWQGTDHAIDSYLTALN